MYKKIMIPVDLEHENQLDKALATGADLGKHYGAEVHVVGVTSSSAGPVAHNPTEYSQRLKDFAARQTSERGIEFQPKSMISHDPAADLDDTLQRAASDIHADLIVMASHIPGFADYIFASRAGYLASHSNLSVFVVR